MQRIVWNESHRVGIEELDAQLREISELINLLGEQRRGRSPSKTAGQIVDTLIADVARHCSLKERMLARHDCDDLWPEPTAGQRFAEAVADYRSPVPLTAARIERLHDFLVDWWNEHVQETQREFEAAKPTCDIPKPTPFGPFGTLAACLWQAASAKLPR